MGLLERWATSLLKRRGYRLSGLPRGIRGDSPPKSEFPSDPYQAQLELLRQFQTPGPEMIFDIGANVGQTATKYRSLFPRAQIVCFEPFPESVAAIRQQHNSDSRIRVIPKALGCERGTQTFHTFEMSGTNSLFPRPEQDRRYFPKRSVAKNRLEVEVETLDDFLRMEQIGTVDILKLDIQGGELNALKGARSLLASGRTPLIYTETHFVSHYEGAPLFHELWAYLSDQGYSLFDVYNLKRARINGQLRFGDALFVSASLRREVLDVYPEEV